MVLERLGDLAVEEAEDLVSALDERHLDAQSRHHASVLGADDAPANHNHGLRQPYELEKGVGTKDRLVVKWDALGPSRAAARRDHEHLGAQSFGVVGTSDFQQVGRDEASRPPDQLDTVALEMAANEVELVADHLLADEDQVGHRDVVFDPIALAEQPPVAGPRQMEDRLAERFGWDGARIDRGAAQDTVFLDDNRLLAELRRLNSGLLPGWARADHCAIEVPHPRGLKVVVSLISGTS